MIVMDTPRIDTFQGRQILTAHMLSTRSGKAGTDELVAFAEQIGMRREWIQYEGTHREHFDLMNGRCGVAMAAGAKITKIGFVLVAKARGIEIGDTTDPDALKALIVGVKS